MKNNRLWWNGSILAATVLLAVVANPSPIRGESISHERYCTFDDLLGTSPSSGQAFIESCIVNVRASPPMGLFAA
ncbi:MAG: hypothetical protein JW818_02965 [Pirellulales bacterium]|nr:hypothetical protein [Pirellulales bacterium]